MLSVGVWAFWYWYPLPQNQLAVNLAYPDGSQFSVLKGVNLPGGVYNGIINGVTGSYWCSFANFPQTMYTVNMNPVNPVGYGTPFLVEDNAVHTTNLLMKIVWAYTVFYFGKVVMRKHKVKYGSK